MIKEEICARGGVECVRFGALAELDFIDHGFMLRKGGVSTGCYESMNLSYTTGDRKEDVDENYVRAAGYFGMKPEEIVAVYQTHTNRVIRVGREDAGSGITRERIYPDADGMVTDESGILLATSHADCVPLFFADPKHRAIGMTHSGWKGTVGKIGAVTIKKMSDEFGTDPADVIAAIGPAICGKCYEVGEEVAELFASMIPAGVMSDSDFTDDGRLDGGTAVDRCPPVLRRKENGKYLLDLKSANLRILMEAGVRPENITVSDFCTFERSDLFFSHRKMGTRRGNHRAFLMIIRSNDEKST